MKKPSIILFTVTNKFEYLTYGLYSLKAYVLRHLRSSSKPNIGIQICKFKQEKYEKDGVSVMLTPEEIQKATLSIVKKKPQIVGFSCTVINRSAILRIARKVKKIDPSIIIVLGGPDTHHNYIHDSKSFMEKEREIDIVAKFEGEELLLELLESILYKKYPLSDVKGIIYRDGKEIVSNAERKPIDLRKIPSPYLTGVYKLKKCIKEYIIENSRGCPYRCAYCSYPAGINSVLRYFPVERVKNEFIFLLKRKVRFINISDNNFNINKKQSMEVLKTIIKYNEKNLTKISVFYNVSREAINDEMIQLLALSKISITIGIQSLSSETLRIAHRTDNLKIVEKNLELLDKYNIPYRLEFIYGLPGDAYQDIQKVINWIFKYNAQWTFFYRLVVLKGTHFSSHAKELGLIYSTDAPFKIIKNNEVDKADLDKIENILILVYLFYNRSQLRKEIYRISNMFQLSFDQIFETMNSWYTRPKTKLLNDKSITKMSQQFFNYLFKNYPIRNIKTIDE